MYELFTNKKIYYSDEFIDENSFCNTAPSLHRFDFKDGEKFHKYIMSDFICEIAEKCNAIWLDDYEEQYLGMDKLPTALEIVKRAIGEKENESIKDYLEITAEFMEKAIELKTFFVFSF